MGAWAHRDGRTGLNRMRLCAYALMRLCSLSMPALSARARALVAIVAVWLLTTVAGLGSTSLSEPDEPRFAEATRQMFLRGDFLTPYFNGVPRFEKPILFYWMQAPAFAVLGPTETAARLPAALCTLGVLLLTFTIGERLLNGRTALVGTLILATTFRFAIWSRQGLTDVPVLLCMVAALYWFAKCVLSAGVLGRDALLAWAAIGLGVLIKGPVAVLPLVIVGGYLIATRQLGLIGRLHIVPGVLIAAAIVLPWYAWMAWLHGRAFLDFALGYEVVARYGSTAFPSFPRSFFWYFQIYPGDAAPWTLFILAAIGWSIWRLRSFAADTRLAVVFLLTWFFAIVLVFSTAKFKVTHYILPAYPAASLLAGLLLDRLFARSADAPAWLWHLPFTLTAAVVAILAVVLAAFLHRVFQTPWLDAGMLMPLALAAAAIVMIVFAVRGAREPAIMTLVAGLSLAMAILAVHVAPRELQRYQPVRALGQRIAAVAGPDVHVGLAGRLGGPGLIFYSRHDITWLDSLDQMAAFLRAPGRRFCVMSPSDFDTLSRDPSLPLRIVDRGQFFNVRLKALFESRPNVEGRPMLLVTRRETAVQ
jgi:4-amino-4-deoxy-L-arabinose transferase-like glycosyltransferase